MNICNIIFYVYRYQMIFISYFIIHVVAAFYIIYYMHLKFYVHSSILARQNNDACIYWNHSMTLWKCCVLKFNFCQNFHEYWNFSIVLTEASWEYLRLFWFWNLEKNFGTKSYLFIQKASILHYLKQSIIKFKIITSISFKSLKSNSNPNPSSNHTSNYSPKYNVQNRSMNLLTP